MATKGTRFQKLKKKAATFLIPVGAGLHCFWVMVLQRMHHPVFTWDDVNTELHTQQLRAILAEEELLLMHVTECFFWKLCAINSSDLEKLNTGSRIEFLHCFEYLMQTLALVCATSYSYNRLIQGNSGLIDRFFDKYVHALFMSKPEVK